MSSLFTPTGMARQIPSAEAIIINLENIPFVTTLDDAELVASGDGAYLWTKYQGKMVACGRIFMGRTGKTVYTSIQGRRYRLASWQFRKVIKYPGFLAPALYCPPTFPGRRA